MYILLFPSLCVLNLTVIIKAIYNKLEMGKVFKNGKIYM